MTNILEAAKDVLNQDTMKNISDLEEVSTSIDLQEETRENSKGETYTVRFIEVNGEKYRVPYIVLKDLNGIKQKKPDLKKFCVVRTGTTKEDTRYQVIAL